MRNYSTRAGGVSSDPAGDDVVSTSVVGPSVYSSDVVSHSFIWGVSIRLGGHPIERVDRDAAAATRRRKKKSIWLCAESSRLADAAYGPLFAIAVRRSK